MRFWNNERGQAIQIGAVLLFGVLIIALSTYQAFVVPDQNKEVEFKHSQTVRQDLQDVRNAFVSLSGSRSESLTVSLGAKYPSRALFLNPGPPTGSLSTAGTANESVNVTIRNATSSGEIRDVWNGSTHRFETGGLVYRPNYNEFTQAPTTIYENTVLFNQFRGQNITLTGQTLVDGDTVSLVTLSGSLSETRQGGYSLEVQPVSVSENRIEVENQSSNVTITVPTRLDTESWRDLLDDEFVSQGGHIEGLRTERISRQYRLLHVDLEPGVTYDLQMKRVGVGTNVSGTSGTYVLPVEGNGSTVPEGGTKQVVVELRDRYNNPVDGQLVSASASLPGGSVSPANKETNSNGQVVLQYDAPADVSGVVQQTEQINVSYVVGSPHLNDSAFRPRTPANTTVQLTVDNADNSGLAGGGGGGAYSVDWLDPSGQTGVSCQPDEDGTCSINGSKMISADLTVGTSPTADGASVSYSVSDRSVGTVDPQNGTTNSDGKNTTTFRLRDSGTVKVYASSGGGGDIVDLDVNQFTTIGETGRVTFNTGTNQKTISLTQSYRNPVIIARPVDDAATEPRYIRVVGNTSDSITLEVDRFENDGLDPQTTVHYLVAETGIHELQDGTTVEVGSNQVDGSYDSVTLDASFSSAPIVFSQTQTVNDDTPVVVRQRNVRTDSFEHKLQESEAAGKSGHPVERVGYVAIQQAQGTANGVTYETGTTGETVRGYDNSFTTITFSQSYSSTPAFFAQMQIAAGINTAWERYRNLDTANVDVTIDEETTSDDERSHTTEDVGYFVFGNIGLIPGTTLSSPGIDTTKPTIDTFSITDNSVTTGSNKKASFEVDWAVSDNVDLSTVDITLTRTSSGTQVDSVSNSVSGTSANGVDTVEEAFSSGNPRNVEYKITLTVTDSAGNSQSQSNTQDGDGNDST